MTRLIPILAALVVAGSAGALIAAGAGADAAQSKRAAAQGDFRHALAAKLGERLDKPADQVLAALKSAAKPVQGGTKADRRAARKAKREQALQSRLDALKKGAKPDPAAARKARDAWAAAVGKALDVDASKVTAALRALIKERMDSLVSQGWMTTGQEDAKLACFDGASSCKGPGPGLGFLRVG
jgi:hypothetical protein